MIKLKETDRAKISLSNKLDPDLAKSHMNSGSYFK